MISAGPPSLEAIEVRDLTCGYARAPVLEGISFKVYPGEIFFVIGGSGCGKSTLLRCMIGLLEPLRGSVLYFGQSFTGGQISERRKLLQTFGVLYQNNALWSSMTLAENISLPLEEYTTLTKRDRQTIVALKLSQVGLSGAEDLYPAELSGGMQKRAALARALALDPAIVFFDEPTSGLDPVTARAMDELILQVRASMKTTMVIVSHKLSSIYRLADRLILLDRAAKGIIGMGKPAELASMSADARVIEFLGRERAAGAASSPGQPNGKQPL